MKPEFWLDRWRTGQIGFHQPKVDRYLLDHWQDLDVPAGSRVLVPLCGKSLSLLWLRDQGYATVGVELSSVAVESFWMEHGIPARRRPEHGFDLYQAANLEVFCGDLFAFTAATLGPIDAVYDRAALISWSEELRDPYAVQMARLTASGVRTLLITVEYPQAQMQGPPFSIPAAEVKRLYADHHEIEELSRHDVLADEPRLRARGLTELQEVCYRLTRNSLAVPHDRHYA